MIGRLSSRKKRDIPTLPGFTVLYSLIAIAVIVCNSAGTARVKAHHYRRLFEEQGTNQKGGDKING